MNRSRLAATAGSSLGTGSIGRDAWEGTTVCPHFHQRFDLPTILDCLSLLDEPFRCGLIVPSGSDDRRLGSPGDAARRRLDRGKRLRSPI